MDTTTAIKYLQSYLDENQNQKPTKGFGLSEPVEKNVQGQVFYYFYWVEDSGRNARGGYSYYVFSDGKVLLPRGGSGQPELAQDVFARWQNDSTK